MTARATEPDVIVIAERAALVLDRVHEIRTWVNARIVWCRTIERDAPPEVDEIALRVQEVVAARAEMRALGTVLRMLEGLPAEAAA